VASVPHAQSGIEGGGIGAHKLNPWATVLVIRAHERKLESRALGNGTDEHNP